MKKYNDLDDKMLAGSKSRLNIADEKINKPADKQQKLFKMKYRERQGKTESTAPQDCIKWLNIPVILVSEGEK